MKYLTLRDMHASQMIAGCMRWKNSTVEEVEQLVKTALEEGVNFFDHADIYGDGKCEELFGEVLKRNPQYRDKMIIQSKCGIVNKGEVTYYDFSKKHILESVDGILQRLHTDYLDILLLHRPDTLMDPKEISEAFDELESSGKVKYFGVSNMNSMQLAYLQSHLKQKLMFNQLKFNPIHAQLVTQSFFVNRKEEESLDHDGSILEYCRMHDITIQAWSTMVISTKEGTYLDHPKYAKLNEVLERIAKRHEVSKSAVVMAWIMYHPAHIQPVFGTANPIHLKDLCKADKVTLTKEEWYQIYTYGLGRNLP